ncbi:MAG: 4'-phosphopantetheinyl transferase superfamily protein [Caldilineaceae bacterium]|nr:4'-phosphopantetheinyl transferase superfamily protein [Caldilineaceae bacterium]
MIRWLIQSVVDHPDLAAGHPPAGLLTPAELAQFQSYLSPRRRRDWLLGRWTAKRLIQTHIATTHGFSPALDSFTVEYDPSGAPHANSHHPALRGTPVDGHMPIALSISHSHGYAFCALCADTMGQARLGADIELVESRADTFANEFFTPDEQAHLHSALSTQTALLATAMWSVKEAALKAARADLRADPRSIQCLPRPIAPRHWTALRVTIAKQNSPELGPLHAWWCVLDNRLLPHSSFVLAIAAYGVIL